jgi:hypothetical protein
VPLGVTLITELGFIAGPALQASGTFVLDDVTNGKLDTNTLGTGDVWTDVSVYVRSGSTSRSSTRNQSPVVQYQPGTATLILKNGDARFSPENLAGPYVSGGVTLVRPMVPARIRATWAGITYPLWQGFADAWQVGGENRGGQYEEMTFTGTDAFKVLSGITLPTEGATGASEDTGARINRILDAAGWYFDIVKRNIATGDTLLQATTMGNTALALMQLAADTELGELYVDETGAVFFRNRLGILTDTRSNTSQAQFGDVPFPDGYTAAYSATYGGATGLPYVAVGRADDDTQLCNDAQITRDGGIMQEASDAASEAAFIFPRTYTADGLLMRTDAEALTYAQFIVYASKGGETRFDTLTINPQRAPGSLWPQVLGRKIGDRITISRQPPGMASPITRDCFIRGIAHDFDFTAHTWLTTWTLQDASRYSFLTLDNAVTGKLDSNALAF